MIFAQSVQQVRDRIEGTERPIVPAQATGESPSSEDKVGNDVAVSDTGAQRPVQLNEKGMSSFVGYNSRWSLLINSSFAALNSSVVKLL